LVKNPKISLSVFFPCHNEQDNIETLTLQTLKMLEAISDDYEVIIVDDGSTDQTAQIAQKLTQQSPHVRLVQHPVNQGYGAALQSGFRAATKQWVFYTDGDGQFDIDELPPLVELIDQYDIVTCYRINRQDSFLRKFNGWAWTKLVNLLFHFKLRDIDCAFKLYRREIFDHIEMQSTGALIDTEILARAKKRGYTMVQTPVHHYLRTAGTQSGASIKVILRAFRELFQLRKKILNE